jgi:hypothetical protein
MPDLAQLVVQRRKLAAQVRHVGPRGEVRRVPQPPRLALELASHAGARPRRQPQRLREPG